MRKNKMMRAASALLVAVLLTTSTISGTFAKYVTQDSASDTARVAKWGVELQVQGNLFADSYVDAIENEKDNAKLAVNSSATDDVVAPGTFNDDGFGFSINGTPEVSGQIKIDKLDIKNIFLKAGVYAVMVEVPTGVVTEENWDEFEAGTFFYLDGGTYKVATTYDKAEYTLEDKVELGYDYYPVVFELAGSTDVEITFEPYKVDTLKEVATVVAGKLGSYNNAYDLLTGITSYTPAVADEYIKFNPNTDLANKFNLGEEILTWAWAFEGQNDGADTILGNLMAGIGVVRYDSTLGGYVAPTAFEHYCLDLLFDLAITVEQIDDAANVVTP